MTSASQDAGTLAYVSSTSLPILPASFSAGMTTVTRMKCPCPQASRDASSIKASRPEDYQSSRASSNLVNEPPSRPPTHALKARKTATVAEAKREANVQHPGPQLNQPRDAVDRDFHR